MKIKSLILSIVFLLQIDFIAFLGVYLLQTTPLELGGSDSITFFELIPAPINIGLFSMVYIALMIKVLNDINYILSLLKSKKEKS